MKAKLAAVGIVGHFPFDNEIPAETSGDLRQSSHVIGRANEQMMRDCCKDGRLGIILVNMMPYHGPSMDVGSAFEVGFMSALAEKENVIIIGYTNNRQTFEDRVSERIYSGGVTKKDGYLFGSDGNMIEAFGGTDNLMITHAIEKTGGRIVYSFDEAVALAREIADRKIASQRL